MMEEVSQYFPSPPLARSIRFSLSYSLPTTQAGTVQIGIAVTLNIRIPEVLGSNLGQDTGSPGRGFSWFSAVVSRKCRDIAPFTLRPRLSKSCPLRQ
jgi:hypothetical protein